MRVNAFDSSERKVDQPSVEMQLLTKNQRSDCNRYQRNKDEIKGVNTFRCNASIDGETMMNFVEAIEYSEMSDSVSSIVVRIFTNHAEIDLWDHDEEPLIHSLQ